MSDEIMMQLWNELQEHLHIRVSKDARTLTLENSSISSPFAPTVRFIEIEIESPNVTGRVDGSPRQLEPGQIVVLELGSDSGDFNAVNVTAAVDQDALFRFTKMSDESIAEIKDRVRSWYQRFDDSNIFGQIDDFIASIPKLSADPKLSEFENLESLGERINPIYSKYNEQVSDFLESKNHANPQKLVKSMLSEVAGQTRRIIKAAQDKDVSKISEAYERLKAVENPVSEFSSLRNRIEAAYLLI